MLIQKHLFKKYLSMFLVSLIIVILTGCGSGGSDSTSINLSTVDNSDSTANASISLNQVSNSATPELIYGSVTQAVEFGARAHLSDVGSVPGLSGQGVSIVIIDDFVTTEPTSIIFNNVKRTLLTTATTSSPAQITVCGVTHEWNTTFLHGQLVQDIAGGKTVALQGYPVNLVQVSRGTDPACSSSFYQGAPSSAFTGQITTSSINGVAPNAFMHHDSVILGSAGAIDSAITVQGHLLNALTSSPTGVINLSLGADFVATSGQTLSTALSAIEAAVPIPSSTVVNSVITVAAGNSGKACNQDSLDGCNVIAVALVNETPTASSTIVVGALTGGVGQQTVADYSTRPGALASRFIYASGDTGFFPDANGNLAQGTSFAAPRVAGVAALLREKYPLLTSAQICDLILSSADKDMNNTGVATFSGIDPIYGNGKLSLANALTLAKQLYP